MKHKSSTKATPPFERESLEVKHRKGTQVVTKRRVDSTTTRSTAHVKKVPDQTSEEAGRWKPGPDTSQGEPPKPTADPIEPPRMEKQP